MNTALPAYPDQSASLSRRPNLQLQLTNAVPISPSCNINAWPDTLAGPDPTVLVQQSSGNTSATTRTIILSPTSCYDFLRLSALPNTSGISEGIVGVFSLSISTLNGVDIVGPTSLALNQQDTYSVQLSGYTLSDNFTWAVTGGLQIVGSNVGPSVTIKNTGSTGGQVSISLNGCSRIAATTISGPITQYPVITDPASVYGGYVNVPYECASVPSVTNYQWTVGGGTIVSGQGTRFVTVSYQPYLPPNTQKNVTMKVVASSSGTYINESTKTIQVKACSTCPEQPEY